MNLDFQCIGFPAVKTVVLNVIFYAHFLILLLCVVEWKGTVLQWFKQEAICLLDFHNYLGDSFLKSFCSAGKLEHKNFNVTLHQIYLLNIHKIYRTLCCQLNISVTVIEISMSFIKIYTAVCHEENSFLKD